MNISYVILLAGELVLFEIQCIHFERPPIPIFEHKLVAGAHRYNCWEIQLSVVHTPHQVSLTLEDSEKTGSSSFLVLSDKLVLVLQFPLVPVFTGEVSILRNCSSSRSESGGVAMLCRIVSWMYQWLAVGQRFDTSWSSIVWFWGLTRILLSSILLGP